jgi:hypothetical protein
MEKRMGKEGRRGRIDIEMERGIRLRMDSRVRREDGDG